MDNYCYQAYLVQNDSAYDAMNDSLKRLFFLISFLPFVSIFSTWMVAKFIWLPYREYLDTLDYEDEEVPYEDRYPIESDSEDEDDGEDDDGGDDGDGKDEGDVDGGDKVDGEEGSEDGFEKVVKSHVEENVEKADDSKGEKGEEEEPEELDEETKKKLHEKYQNMMVMDQTPMGNVMIRYNVMKDCFDYWSDTKNVKYEFLQTITRKFVLTFDCASLYKDRMKNIRLMEEEIERAIQEKEEAEREELERKKKAEEDGSDEVDGDGAEGEEEDSDDDLFVKKKEDPKQVKDREHREHFDIECNKYVYCGKIQDFFEETKEVKVIQNENVKLTFDDFKKMMDKAK